MKTYPPLTKSHPLIRNKRRCPDCGERFRVGDVTVAVQAMPKTEEDRKRRKAGRAYDAKVGLAHAECPSDERE